MEFFGQAIETLKALVIALGAGLGVWGDNQSSQRLWCGFYPGENAHVR